MRNSYARLSKLVPLFLALLFSWGAKAQVEYELSLRFNVINKDSGDIFIDVRNTGANPLILGDSKLHMFFNDVTHIGGFGKARIVRNPQSNFDLRNGYDTLRLEQDAAAGSTMLLSISKDPIGGGSGFTVSQGQTVNVAQIRTNIINCANTLNLGWVQLPSLIFNYTTGDDIKLNPGVGTATFRNLTPIRLSIPLPSVPTAAVTPVKVSYCADETITITAQPGFPGLPFSSFQLFFKRGNFVFAASGVSPTRPGIGSPSPNNTISFSISEFPNLQSGDSVFVQVTNSNCTYQSVRTVLNFQPRVAKPEIAQGVGSGPTKILFICQDPTTTLTINPVDPNATAGYTWFVDNSVITNVSSLIPGNSQVLLTWAPGTRAFRTRVIVRGTNVCDQAGFPGLTDTLIIQRDNDRPTPPTGLALGKPTSKNNKVCITDPDQTVATGIAGLRNGTYQFFVRPAAAGTVSVAPVPDSILPVRATFNWNRNYRKSDSTITIRAVSINGCGTSDTVNLPFYFRPLPPKPDAISRLDRNPTDGDTTCIRTDSTMFIVRMTSTDTLSGAPNRDSLDPAQRFYWFVQPAANNPAEFPRYLQDTVLYNAQPTLVTRGDTVVVKWAKRFAGWVTIAVAAKSRACSFGNTLYTFSAANSRVNFTTTFNNVNPLGDTISMRFYVRPTPEQSVRPTPSNPITPGSPVVSLCKGSIVPGPGGTTFTVSIPANGSGDSRYNRFHIWSVEPSSSCVGGPPQNPLPIQIASVQPGTKSREAVVTFTGVPEVGRYYITNRGQNPCGVGPKSQPVILEIGDTAALGIASVDIAPRRTVPTGFDPFSLCAGGQTLKVTAKLRPASSGGSVTLCDSITSVRWVVFPALAGTIQPFTAGGRSDSTTVSFVVNPSYSGPYRIMSYAVNGCESDTSRITAKAKTGFIRSFIYTSPSLYLGMSGPSDGIPVHSKYALGGNDSYNFLQVPNTVVDAFPPYNVIWFNLPPAAGLLPNSTFAFRPVTTPTSFSQPIITFNDVSTSSSYNPTGIATNIAGCASPNPNPSQPQITILSAYQLRLENIFLEGAYNFASGTMHDSLFTQTSVAGSPDLLTLNYRRTDASSIGRTYPTDLKMNPGYTLDSIQRPAGVGIVDVIKVDILDDQDNLHATGFAWLLTNGEVRDFENGLEPIARVVKPGFAQPLTNGGRIRITHRNHLPIVSSNLIPLTSLNLAEGGGPYVRPTNPQSFGSFATVFSKAAQGVTPTASYRGVKLDAGRGNRVIIPAGDVEIDLEDQVDSQDAYQILNYLRNQTSQNIEYSVYDANLSGRVTRLDANIVLGNNNKLVFATIP